MHRLMLFPQVDVGFGGDDIRPEGQLQPEGDCGPADWPGGPVSPGSHSLALATLSPGGSTFSSSLRLSSLSSCASPESRCGTASARACACEAGPGVDVEAQLSAHHDSDPVVPPQPPQALRPGTMASPLAGLRVLYVDDEGINRSVAKRMLDRLGCTPTILSVRSCL
jgi:hypothetical protein